MAFPAPVPTFDTVLPGDPTTLPSHSDLHNQQSDEIVNIVGSYNTGPAMWAGQLTATRTDAGPFSEAISLTSKANTPAAYTDWLSTVSGQSTITPDVAGWYQVSLTAKLTGGTTDTTCLVWLSASNPSRQYKGGETITTSGDDGWPSLSVLVYMNGTTSALVPTLDLSGADRTHSQCDMSVVWVAA